MAKKVTAAQRQIDFLTELYGGPLEEVKSKASKYRAFIHLKMPGVFYFIGKAGALRVGKNISTSFSVSGARGR